MKRRRKKPRRVRKVKMGVMVKNLVKVKICRYKKTKIIMNTIIIRIRIRFRRK